MSTLKDEWFTKDPIQNTQFNTLFNSHLATLSAQLFCNIPNAPKLYKTSAFLDMQSSTSRYVILGSHHTVFYLAKVAKVYDELATKFNLQQVDVPMIAKILKQSKKDFKINNEYNITLYHLLAYINIVNFLIDRINDTKNYTPIQKIPASKDELQKVDKFGLTIAHAMVAAAFSKRTLETLQNKAHNAIYYGRVLDIIYAADSKTISELIAPFIVYQYAYNRELLFKNTSVLPAVTKIIPAIITLLRNKHYKNDIIHELTRTADTYDFTLTRHTYALAHPREVQGTTESKLMIRTISSIFYKLLKPLTFDYPPINTEVAYSIRNKNVNINSETNLYMVSNEDSAAFIDFIKRALRNITLLQAREINLDVVTTTTLCDITICDVNSSYYYNYKYVNNIKMHHIIYDKDLNMHDVRDPTITRKQPVYSDHYTTILYRRDRGDTYEIVENDADQTIVTSEVAIRFERLLKLLNEIEFTPDELRKAVSTTSKIKQIDLFPLLYVLAKYNMNDELSTVLDLIPTTMNDDTYKLVALLLLTKIPKLVDITRRTTTPINKDYMMNYENEIYFAVKFPFDIYIL